MASRTLVGFGTKFAKMDNLAVSGVTQSLSSRPPVSPELGLRHHTKLSVMSLDFR